MKLLNLKIMRKKTFIRKQKNYPYDQGGHARCKDSITIKKMKEFVREGEKE
jgi:hypothetical protein